MYRRRQGEKGVLLLGVEVRGRRKGASHFELNHYFREMNVHIESRSIDLN